MPWWFGLRGLRYPLVGAVIFGVVTLPVVLAGALPGPALPKAIGLGAVLGFGLFVTVRRQERLGMGDDLDQPLFAKGTHGEDRPLRKATGSRVGVAAYYRLVRRRLVSTRGALTVSGLSADRREYLVRQKDLLAKELDWAASRSTVLSRILG